MSALISVIIPVYNVAEYLPQCLDSVLSQTFRNLEIIAVDDGSTDGSGAICDDYAARDSRIRVIHKPNGGVSSARNAGLRAATGALIGFVDADDWTEPEMYEKLAQLLNNADIAICGFFDYPYGMDKPIPRGTKSIRNCGFEDAVIQILSRDGYYCTLWNKAFRRAVVEGIEFDRSLSFGEDEVWLLRAMKNSRSIAFTPAPLYHWRKREGSATRFSHVSARQLSLMEAKKQSFKLLPDREDIVELAKSKMFNDCFFLKLQAYCTGDWENYHLIDKILRPMESSWLKSDDTPLLRKAKVIVMDVEMKLRMPGGVVRFTDNVKKMHR